MLLTFSFIRNPDFSNQFIYWTKGKLGECYLSTLSSAGTSLISRATNYCNALFNLGFFFLIEASLIGSIPLNVKNVFMSNAAQHD